MGVNEFGLMNHVSLLLNHDTKKGVRRLRTDKLAVKQWSSDDQVLIKQ